MASRRTRSTKRGVLDHMQLLAAIKAIKIEKKTVKSTAEAYKIDRKTLSDYIAKIDAEVTDISVVSDEDLLNVIQRIAPNANMEEVQMIFDEEQEEVLVDYVMKSTKHYSGCSIIELKQLAYQFAIRLGVNYPPSWNESEMADEQWFDKFMQRHSNLSLQELDWIISSIDSMQEVELQDNSNRDLKLEENTVLTFEENQTEVKIEQ